MTLPSVVLLHTTPGWRGSGKWTGTVAAGLAGRGVPVEVLAASDEVAGGLRDMGVEAVQIRVEDTGRREVAAVRRSLDRSRAGIVICNAPRDVRLARYATVWRRRKLVWAYNLHSRALPSDPLQQWIFRGLDHLVHQSAHSAAKLGRESPWLARKPSTRIANGLDATRYRPDPAARLRFRRRHGLTEDDRLVLTPTGALPEKSIDVAALAVALAAGDGPLTWAVCDSRPAVERLLPDDFNGRLLALGWLPEDEVHDAMQAADVVLLPGAVEIFGYATAEAMALGGVVLAADGGATPEVLGAAGILFPPGDHRTAAGRLVELFRDAPGRRALGLAARARITDEFPLEAMIDGYERLVRQLG